MHYFKDTSKLALKLCLLHNINKQLVVDRKSVV